MLTKQQIYDKALFGIRKQGKPSVDDLGNCKYRALPDPQSPGPMLACAAGQLIPDNVYDRSWDYPAAAGGTSFTRLSGDPYFRDAMYAEGIDLSDRETVGLIREMQHCHDVAQRRSQRDGNAFFMTEFEFEMQSLARSFNLTYTPPAEA